MILDGDKSWELRSSDTTVRGRIALIDSGTGKIVGEATLARTMLAPTKLRGRRCTSSYHRIPEDQFHLMDKWKWVWVLEDVLKYEKPLGYEHPRGAVIWVNLRA